VEGGRVDLVCVSVSVSGNWIGLGEGGARSVEEKLSSSRARRVYACSMFRWLAYMAK
jgi:hypothetical protein